MLRPSQYRKCLVTAEDAYVALSDQTRPQELLQHTVDCVRLTLAFKSRLQTMSVPAPAVARLFSTI